MSIGSLLWQILATIAAFIGLHLVKVHENSWAAPVLVLAVIWAVRSALELREVDER